MSDMELTPEGFHEVMTDFVNAAERLREWCEGIKRLPNDDTSRIFSTVDSDIAIRKRLETFGEWSASVFGIPREAK